MHCDQRRPRLKPLHAGVIVLLLLLLHLSGCASHQPVSAHFPFQANIRDVQWRSLSVGVEATDVYDKRLPLILHIVKVDLKNPAISIVTSEEALFQNDQGCILAETVKTFAKRRNTVVAFNAAAFQTNSVLFSTYRKIVGIHITNFRRMSPPLEQYAAILFYADKTARIINSQKETFFTDQVCHALSGFKVILQNGEVLPQKVQRRDSRTALGIADKGTILFIFAVEGENKRKSQGLSYEETAYVMKEFGVTDAVQLDGGSSSTLVIQEQGSQKVVSPRNSWLPLIRTASNAGIVLSE